LPSRRNRRLRRMSAVEEKPDMPLKWDYLGLRPKADVVDY
jgi:hypothetical protein